MPATDPLPVNPAAPGAPAHSGASSNTAARHIATLERLLALDVPTVREALDQAADEIAAALDTDKIDYFLYEALS